MEDTNIARGILEKPDVQRAMAIEEEMYQALAARR